MAGSAVLRKLSSNMIWLSRLKVREVTTDAVGRGAVVSCGMTGGTVESLMSQLKPKRLRMSEGCRLPGRKGVAGRAVCAKSIVTWNRLL